MSSHLNSTKANRELHRPNPLRGFWNRKNAKAGPCVSRPDLVAERNEASQVTRYQVVPARDVEAKRWHDSPAHLCEDNSSPCDRRRASSDNTCQHYPSRDYCVVRRSTGRVVYPEHGYTSRDNCDDWIAWGIDTRAFGVAPRFLNEYKHCGVEWEDVWDSTCNDRCPVCNKEIEPHNSEDLGIAS